MKEKGDKSIVLSKGCVLLFALLLAVLDLGCYWIAGWYIRLRYMPWQSAWALMASVYVGSVFGWVCLYKLWRLLGNLGAGAVFTAENVGLLRAVSRCCVGAALVCLVSSVYYLPFLLLALAAGFMALIVRIVKNVFQQAVAMKSELDLTI